MEDQIQTVVLSLKLTDAVIGYLAKQPYEQTAGLIHAIQQEARASLPIEEVEVNEETGE
jgi:hypothetical protein